MRFTSERIILAASLAAVCAACATAPPVPAEPPLEVAALVEGVRLGVVVARLDGAVIRAARADERFMPASNTKLFTAAAAFHYLPDLETPDPALGTSLRIIPQPDGTPPDLRLVGAGDPQLRDSPDCIANCLHELADAVAARGISRIGDVYADATLFPFEPYGLGWSWNNLPFYFGAPVSALTLNGNAVTLRVGPAEDEGAPVEAQWAMGDDVLRLRNEAVTGPAGSANLLSVARWPGTDTVVLSGSFPADSRPRNFVLSVPQPESFAADRLVRLLSARGVSVVGEVIVLARHDDRPAGEEIARLSAPALAQTVADVSLDSDNLSAELLLRHIARATGGDGAEDGLDALHWMLDAAGIGRAAIELYDGSGLSPYNRVTPQGVVDFLLWTQQQSWASDFRSTLPVGGQSGSLARRFRGTALEGKIQAKTGTVQGVNALSGFMQAASGKWLAFSVIANDRPADADPVLPLIDAFLLETAAAN